MAGADPTTYGGALKSTYTENRLAEQLYDENPLLREIRKRKVVQVGEEARTPVHTGRNWGYTPLPASGGTLNPAGQQEIKRAVWQYKHHNMQVKIQGSAIDATKGDALAVAEVIDTEVAGAVGDLERQLTRQLFMSGDALIAQCGTTAAVAEVELNATTGFNAIERGWLAPGAYVDIGTTANEVAIADGIQITAVEESSTTPSITLASGTYTTTNAHYVSIRNARVGTTSYEMNGLPVIVDSTADLGGLSPATTPSWASYEDSTSQALTLPLMYTANRKVMQKTGKGSNYVVTSLKQQEKFYGLVQAQVRFAGDQNLGAGNVDGVRFNGMTVYAQPDCPNEHMYFLTIDDLLLASSGDPAWQNKFTGGETLAWIQNEDAYGGKVTVRHELGARRRNSHAKLTGLT
jgi:hypothetical protein